jgi:BlaI family transcriptional regulator, penicillinase repressor
MPVTASRASRIDSYSMYCYNMSHMKSARRRSAAKPPLSSFEHEVMHAVWSAGPSSVELVHSRVSRGRDVKEVTTRTVLRRLEQKGYLEHDVAGRAFIYRAVDAPRNLAARAVRQVIDRLCHGSVDELVSGLVESDVLSADELKALEEGIRARARQKAPQKGR